MNKKYIHFSLIACALCVGFLSTAIAAPSVKRLGGMNTYAGTSGAVSAKTGKVGIGVKTNSGSRMSSVSQYESLINTKKAVSVKNATSGTDSESSRLSVGQYLHNAGVVSGKIKPISGSSGSSITPSDVSDLTLRITNLENNKADKGDYYTKDEIDASNYLTQTDVENNYVTKTEIENNYATTTEIQNTYITKNEVQDSYATKQYVDDKLSDGAGTVDDWNANKPGWAN